jgi:hypothetical protein
MVLQLLFSLLIIVIFIFPSFLENLQFYLFLPFLHFFLPSLSIICPLPDITQVHVAQSFREWSRAIFCKDTFFLLFESSFTFQPGAF